MSAVTVGFVVGGCGAILLMDGASWRARLTLAVLWALFVLAVAP